MIIKSIKTHRIEIGESLLAIIDRYVGHIQEKSILAIASKVISACENNTISKTKKTAKLALIKEESDKLFMAKDQKFFLTQKDNRLLPNAGIDESNVDHCYILLPKNPQLTAKKIWTHLRKKHSLKNLGVIITDSNLTPLRVGVTGIAIGWCGFIPVYSYIGKKDLFQKTMEVTKVNLIDSLATAATLIMGEGDEQSPMAILSDLPPTITFKNSSPSKYDQQSVIMDPQIDLFRKILKI
jgi:putative folate metabolism gamma-glutamate ligase